ncbi:MAG TPA: M28 family peptidase [Thermoanaerobaculia bacterium]|nr:M28 family peptidase [Thermoanaerobaculia bacterium]
MSGKRREGTLGLAFLVVFAAGTAVAQDATVLIERLTGPSSRLETDLRVLTDQIGGRVTGSAGYEKALQWGVDGFRRAGVDSVKLESYPIPASWEGISATASVVSPGEFPLRVVSLGLAPSTPGPVTAAIVDVGDGRRADFERLGAMAKGAIALVHSKPMLSFDDVFAEYQLGPETMQAAVDHGLAAILFTSTRPRDLLYRHTMSWGPISPIPMAQLAREDGLRLARLFQAGAAPRVTLDIRNKVGGPGQARNVVAEIRGSEKPDEIVLLGAHLDAWDLGTGALDNGVNCALVVEVARAIAAGPKPKRTIRFVLFTGEEVGLLGSFGYVRAHRAELDRHVAVLIHDIGDGKTVGYFTNGRPELDARVKAALAPVASWGADGADEEAILGTDNFDFLLEGVPNLVANQETGRYLADYHASSDTFDKVDLELARRNAAIAAVAVMAIANAPERLGPRQTRDEVAKILADPRWTLGQQMKTYGIWPDWETTARGRAK